MVFSSAVFLFVFLPAVLLLYFVPVCFWHDKLETGRKNLVLCVASLVFYAWGEPVYVMLMLLSIAFNFNIGLDIGRHADSPRRKKAILAAAVVFDLLILGFFKYSNFLIANLNHWFALEISPLRLSLPVGISFYTFQILSYIVDVYRGEVQPQKNVLSFAMYVTMFPQLIAGPIVQYADIERQLRSRRVTPSGFFDGVTVFIRGLGKKVLFANTIGQFYTEIVADGVAQAGAATAWLGILCYTMQIYFDFGGYSDMFRDYVYIPLGGNRKGVPRTILNLAIVWCLTGLWHGAAWNFVAWGAFYGILLIAEKYLLAGVLVKIPKAVRHVVTMVIVMVGWVFFSCESLSDAIVFLRSMCCLNGNPLWNGRSLYYLAGCAFPLALMSLSAFGVYDRIPKLRNDYLRTAWNALLYGGIFALCVVYLVSSTYNPFLYFRF